MIYKTIYFDMYNYALVSYNTHCVILTGAKTYMVCVGWTGSALFLPAFGLSVGL